MTIQADPDIQGNLFTHPSAELIAELITSGVTGSLRLDNKDRKCIVYFNDGKIVFAVSNARSARLFQLILDGEHLPEAELAKAPNIANDIELAAYLQATGSLSQEQAAGIFSQQIERIILDVLSWENGNWSFSPLKRVRGGLEFKVDAQNLMVGHARALTSEATLSRFRSLDERFRAPLQARQGLELGQSEAVMFSHTSDQPITLSELISLSGQPDDQALHAVYTLWLGGFLVREDYRPALPRDLLATFKDARVAVKQEAKMPSPVLPEKEKPRPEPIVLSEIGIEEYLKRVENAATYYDALGVDPRANLSHIKMTYLTIAKTFHPDRYHSEDPALLKRIQNAFAAIMEANETLKSQESRDLYDYRIRKELGEMPKSDVSGDAGNARHDIDQASQNFERGYSLLNDGQYSAAVPYLARAVHYAPNTPRYRAYFGKALSSDPAQRHKAEAEMQAAIKQDPDNPTYRLMLTEFFIDIKLLKRAEGELNRLLAAFPNNREAQEMLASLKAQA